MRLSRRTLRRSILWGGLLLLAAGLAAPYLSADRFGDRIRRSLEISLHRKVEIESAGFSLFRGPGFTLQRVVIYDDPSAGAEPFAYVSAIEARVRLASLLRGRLEFSALRLEEPSVNLAKTASGPWNFQQLLSPDAAARLPAISVRGGRLNFKLGGVKSVFYFSDADLDLRPPRAPGGMISLEFSGEATRSDRPARGFSTLRGQGRWRPSPVSAGLLELELDMERSSLGELATLVHGHHIGVDGQVAGQAKVRGPLSDLEISGTLQMRDIHRWDLLPPYAEGGPLSFRGKLDLLSQDLEIETVPSVDSALSVRFRAFDYLVHPRWVVGLQFNRLPVAPLVEVARHMGANFPGDVQAEGEVSGALTYSPADSFQGSVWLDGTSIRAPGGPAVRFEEAQLVLEGDRVRLLPAAAIVGEREKAGFQLDYLLTTQRLDLKLTTPAMSIAALQHLGGPLAGVSPPEFLSNLQDGLWSGSLSYRRQGPPSGEWSGALKLSETQVAVPGFSPVALREGVVKVHDGGLDVTGIQAAAGDVEIRGEYRYRPGNRRPHWVNLRIPRLEASELERLMAPTLQRTRGFLSRTLRLSRGAVPEWLEDRRAQGILEIGSLQVAGQSLESVRLRFFWDGPAVEVSRFQARVAGGDAQGHLVADLSGPEPTVKAAGRLESASWSGGTLEGDGSIVTSGSGDELCWNLRAEGFFRARSASLSEQAQVPALSGDWSLRWDRKQPRLRLFGLRMVDGSEVLTGEGTTTEDQRVEIDLSSALRHLHLSGTLKPLRLEAAEVAKTVP